MNPADRFSPASLLGPPVVPFDFFIYFFSGEGFPYQNRQTRNMLVPLFYPFKSGGPNLSFNHLPRRPPKTRNGECMEGLERHAQFEAKEGPFLSVSLLGWLLLFPFEKKKKKKNITTHCSLIPALCKTSAAWEKTSPWPLGKPQSLPPCIFFPSGHHYL